MAIKAYRSGETARRWANDCYKERLAHRTDEILFTLSMPSKGGGVTEVQLSVTTESFEALARSMSDANEDAANRGFVSAGRWDLIVQNMVDLNKEAAFMIIGKVLNNNEDAVVGACGTILLDYQKKLDTLRVAELRKKLHIADPRE